MNITIKHRIYWSFSLLVCLFVINGVFTILTLKGNKKLGTDIFRVMGPSIQALDDFEKVMLESKMYTSNWVFMRYDQEDKQLLKKLHDSGYAALKTRITAYSSQWADKNQMDSLNRIYTGFEELLAIEKTIMGSLKTVKDYDDPAIKPEAERKVKEEILPRTAALINSLKTIRAFSITIRTEKGIKLEKSAMKLRTLSIVLTIIIIFAGFLLSMYMSKVIIQPVNKIRQIINNLGLGIIQKIDHYHSRNEIGKMIYSVNKLSERLQASATFAQQTGLRNFDLPFQPLSNEDTLGQALIAMRDNLKSGDEKINQAQHIAHLGSLEKDMATGRLYLSDEMFNILDIDPVSFDHNFQDILKLIHPQYLDAFKKYRENYLRGLQPDDFECRIVTPKGVTKFVIIQSKVIADARGKLTRIVGIIQDITERKKTEEQIRLSNERYELVTKSTTDMIWDWDLVNNTIFRNDNYNKLFGDDEGDRNEVGKWIKLVHPDDKGWISDYISQKVKDPDAESFEVEFRYFRYNGELAYLYDRGYIIRDENKKAIRMVGATCDITERKMAEAGLIQSEQYNRNLFDQSPVGLALSRMDGKLEDVNEAYAKITGHTIEECKMKSYYEITPEKYSAQEAEQLKDLELTGRYGPYEKEYIHKDGHLVPVRLSGTILERNGIKYIWSSVEDITEQKKAKATLRKSEERYRQIVETSQEGIWLIDENKKTTFVNKRICEMLGYSPAEMMGKDLFHFMDAEGKKIANASLANQKKSGTDHLDFKFLTREGGVVWTFLATSAVLDDGGNYIGGLAMVTDITERKKTENKLALNEHQLAVIYNTVADVIFMLSVEENGRFKFISVNQTFLDTTGLTAGQVMGQYADCIIPAPSWSIAKAKYTEAIRIKDTVQWEEISHYPLGTKVGLVSVTPVLDEEGNTIRLVGSVHDITERKKAEDALSNNELRFRTLTGSAPVGIFQTDINGKTIYVNETWLEYTGMLYEETLGDGWLAAIHPADREIMINDWHARSQKGLESSTEYRLIDKKGNMKWVMGKAVPIFNKSGELFGHIGTVSDITERKLAIESLQQSEYKYRQIVETAQEGIWLIDENDTTSFVNNKMCEILEYSREELTEKKIYQFMDDESGKNSLEQIARRKQGNSEIHDTGFITKSGKHVWVNISTNPVLDEKGKYKGALAMMTDITRRKLDEELLHQSELNLAVKNNELEGKNKELEQFAYVASHDLQEPLRTTSAFVELFQQQYKGRLDEKADKYLAYIVQASDRMKVLITDLLEYSRIGSKQQLKQMDCTIMLNNVLADLGVAIAEAGAKITAGELPVVNGYPTEIKQLFQNLIINAIKFRRKNIPCQIHITAQKKGCYWQFAFADNGIGISKEHYDRIFVIFQRLHTRSEYKGSGIGLSHCKKIVELHQGNIWLESALGKGTTFYFTIPQKIINETEIKLRTGY